MNKQFSWGVAAFVIASIMLLAGLPARAADAGHADFTVDGNDMLVVEIAPPGVRCYDNSLCKVGLMGTDQDVNSHIIKISFPRHLRPGTYKVIGAQSKGRLVSSDKPIPNDSNPGNIEIAVSYSCLCEHHKAENTYARGPAHGRFVVTSFHGKRISAHFKFTQTTPDGKDKVVVSGRLVDLDVGE